MNFIINELLVRHLIDKDTFLQMKNVKNPLDFIYDYFLKNNLDIKELLSLIQKEFGMEHMDLSRINVTKSILESIEPTLSQKYKVYCIGREKEEVSLVTYELTNDIDIINNLINDLYPLKMKIYFAFKNEVEDFLSDIVNNKNREIRHTDTVVEKTTSDNNMVLNPKDAIKKVDTIIKKAISFNASDIHIEPIGEEFIRIRLRIDGDLISVKDIEIYYQEYTNIVSRIKVLAELDPAERRKSQDGKIASYGHEDKIFDLRVSSMSTIFGEKIVIRLIPKITGSKDLSSLGFSDLEAKKIDNLISKPNGIVLVTGETGSGKSTTVYTMIHMLNNDSVNICTVEDPVETEILGVSQVQVNELADITFASALKTFLRQDPDIISVGEIRDYETADIAIKAANTGHLVLSTIHTNNTTSTINRLISMGIESYKISEGIIGIISQRLVKKLCPHCKKVHVLNEDDKTRLGKVVEKNKLGDINDLTFYEANPLGCPSCNKGYKGRLVIPEILEIDEQVNSLIAKKLTSVELREQILDNRDIFLPFNYTVFFKKDYISIDTIKEFI